MPRVLHFELTAEDPDRVIKFFDKTFGWKIDKWKGSIEYWNIRTGDPSKPGIDGGISLRSSEHTVVVNSIYVQSIDDTLEKVEANGGRIIRSKFVVTSVGW